MSILDDQIEHLVVLMMENRSFDHLLGYLTKEEGRSDIHGLTGQEANLNPLTGQPVFVYPFPPGDTAFRPDPLHSYSDVMQQLGGPANPATMQGFIRNFATTTEGQGIDPSSIMGYYQKAHLPVYDALANHYCICDQWHSSVPGETWPNRLFSLDSLSQALEDCGTASARTDAPLAPVVSPVAGVRRLVMAGEPPQLSAFQQLMQGVKEQCLSHGVPPEQL